MALLAVALQCAEARAGALRTENFDREPPDWEGVNNRSLFFPTRTVVQDFGYSGSTAHINAIPGELGGAINPAGEPAFYAYRLPRPLNLQSKLAAEGKIFVTTDTRPRFDFGWSPTQSAGGEQKGELGGLIFRGDCRERQRMASYGDRISTLTLGNRLHAHGKVAVLRAISDSTASIGFYNSKSSLATNASQNQSIPMDFLGINIEGPSSEGFFFYPVYRVHGNSAKALGADGGRSPRIFPDRAVHDWALDYNPEGANGNGEIVLRLDTERCSVQIEPGDKQTGATFDRFGICTTWVDGNSVTV